MAKSSQADTSEEDHKVSTRNLHRLLEAHTRTDTDVASERMRRLSSLYGKDAPRDHFIATSALPKSSSAADAHGQDQDSYFTNTLSYEITDSAKAVKGSYDEASKDGRVLFQNLMVTELIGHLANDSSDKLYRRGKEAEPIVNATDRAFSDLSSNHFDNEVPNDVLLWSLAVSTLQKTEAFVQGQKRARGK